MAVLISLLGLFPWCQAPNQEPVDFARDVRPILSDNCFQCHGPDPATRKSGLRLDTAKGALAELATGGHAIVPGDAEESELMARVDPLFAEEVMPPLDSGKSLNSDEIDTLRRWIANGATWGDHWSFNPPQKVAQPGDGALADDTPEAIDAFLEASLARVGLEFQPEAQPDKLLRRVTLDLTGLPPSSDERLEFVRDIESAGLETAYRAAVDRLLASPRYGVHMARNWLDAARYADTHGLHLDNRRSMWPYRDWVVNSINRNQPFDEFTVDQIAGDMLPDPSPEQVIASGFNRCNPTSAEGGMIAEEYLSIYAKDRADTTAKVWLGLTLECAQCHDHKFDPISQRDYYGMYAFFNSLDEEASDRNIENPRPFVRAMDAAARSENASLLSQIAELSNKLDSRGTELETSASAWIKGSRERVAERWRIASPISASATEGADLVIDSVSGEVTAQGANPANTTYEIEFDVAPGAIEGIRLDALVPEGKRFPGRAHNENFVLTNVAVEAAPLDDLRSIESIELRTARATFSQDGWPIAGVLDPSSEQGWAALGLDGNRSALLLPSRRFGFDAGTRLRVRLEFASVHKSHSLARFRIAVGSVEGSAPSLSESLWWRASFESDQTGGLYENDLGPEAAAIAGDLDVLSDAGGGAAWEPEPRLIQNVTHSLPSGLGVHYLVRRFVAAQPGTYQLRLGSDDGLMVWLNGDLIHENPTPRAVALDQDLVQLDLQAGSNEVLVKVVNTGGLSGFAWRLWDAEGKDDLAPELSLALQTNSSPPEDDANLPGETNVRASLWTLALREVDSEWRSMDDLRSKLQVDAATLTETLPTTLVSSELAQRRDARMQMRGAYDQLGDVVPPATPAILPPLPAGGDADRLALARWLVDEGNPLTARVWVNRAWQHFFGIGIVSTPEDFGSQGAWPTHPELLDWLAVTFMEEGWDRKATHRRFVLSRAYRQSARRSPEQLEIDPEGALVSRGPRFRLAGEVLRDQALYLAGVLDEGMGGPGVFPYQPDGVWFAVGYTRSNTVRYAEGAAADQRRRSLYTFWKRTAPPPNLTTFDAPMRDTCTVRRERTNTPLQALVTLNDPTYVEAARLIAARVTEATDGVGAATAAKLFEHVVGRAGTQVEIDEMVALAKAALAEFKADPAAAEALCSTGKIQVDGATESLLPTELLATWTVVASTLLNLDEVLTNS